MAATAARSRMVLKKAPVRYKKRLDQRLNHGKAKVTVGDYLWLDTQGEKIKDKIGGHTEGPFLILYRTTRTFLIQRDDHVELVNSSNVEIM